MIYLVPTPIGNMGDITQRAIEVLGSADVIACEDTRHSARLLNQHDIRAQLVSLHDHNEEKRVPELIELAKQGQTIAIISDAGMPLVSDPGYRFVQACIAEGLEFTVLPGPSAVVTALAGSGLPCHAFQFDGFLPVKKGKRTKALEAALASGKTSLFFESPHRIGSTLEILAELSPQAQVCVARELSKKFETYHRGTAESLAAEFGKKSAKGEIVLLIHQSS